VQIDDDDEVEIGRRLIGRDVGQLETHLDTSRLGETSRLLEPDGREIDTGDGAALLGEPNGIATSRARPGDSPLTSATRNRFGSAVHTRPTWR
jgi:hypothetical protein